MVNELIIRDFNYRAVHVDAFPDFLVHCRADCIEGAILSDSVPFVFREAIIVIGVDDGELSLSERDSSEGIAVAEASIQKHRQRQEIIQPIRDFDF